MIYVVVSVIALWILAALFGVGKNTVFTKPHTMSDKMLERTVVLTQRIMDSSDIGSKRWTESSNKFSAAVDEQRRRAGLPPFKEQMERYRAEQAAYRPDLDAD